LPPLVATNTPCATREELSEKLRERKELAAELREREELATSSMIASKLVEYQLLRLVVGTEPNLLHDELCLIQGTECCASSQVRSAPSTDPKFPLDDSDLLCKGLLDVLLSCNTLRRKLSGSVVLDLGDSGWELEDRVHELLLWDELRRKNSGSVVLDAGS
jgi:hypothetical protein